VAEAMELAGLSPAHLISVVGRTLAHPVFLIIAHYKYYYLLNTVKLQ